MMGANHVPFTLCVSQVEEHSPKMQSDIFLNVSLVHQVNCAFSFIVPLWPFYLRPDQFGAHSACRRKSTEIPKSRRMPSFNLVLNQLLYKMDLVKANW